jgi:cytochrome c oxidase subunit 2
MNSGTSQNTNNGSGTLVPVLVGLTVALIVGGFLISLLTPSLFPVQASAESQQIDGLFRVLLGVGGAIFLLVEGLLLYSIIRFRRQKGDLSDGPTVHGNTTLELIWTAIPSVIVVFLVIYSYIVWVDIREPKDNELVVEAIGARYAWTFNYADDRIDQPINSGVLHTYVGRPVRMEMETEDVIHSFWVPAMRIKQDLLPGRRTDVRFTPTEPGEYDVVCTELCGGGHGLMAASIVVHPDEETYLAAFLEPEVDRILNPPEDPVERGRQVINAYACQGCHVLDEQGWSGVTGPSMNGIGDRASRRVAGQTAEEYLYTSIYYPNAYVVPGYQGVMPQFQPVDPDAPNYMPREDIIAIVAYMCTQTETGESACDADTIRQIDADDQAARGG